MQIDSVRVGTFRFEEKRLPFKRTDFQCKEVFPAIGPYNAIMTAVSPKDEHQIRMYRQTDFSELHRIDQICFADGIAFTEPEMLFYLSHPGSIIAVAERGGEIVGFAAGQIEVEASAHIFTLDVIPEVRRQGVGTKLMRSLHQSFRDRNVKLVDLEVSVRNYAAQRLYERLQYRSVAVLHGYYRGREDAYRMMLLL
jgi:ribosomal-protein-alanine N-acetyltransferase